MSPSEPDPIDIPSSSEPNLDPDRTGSESTSTEAPLDNMHNRQLSTQDPVQTYREQSSNLGPLDQTDYRKKVSTQLQALLDMTVQHEPLVSSQMISASLPLSEPVLRQRIAVQKRKEQSQQIQVLLQVSLKRQLIPQRDITQNQLRSAVSTILRTRLQNAGVQAADLDDLFFHWLLPRPGAVLADWFLLINNPTLLPKATMERMFQLELSTRYTTNPEKLHKFYIRTFCFDIEQSKHLLNKLSKSMHDPSWELAALLCDEVKVAQKYSDSSMIHIRYCGTTSKDSGWKRHEEDLCAKATATPLSIFLRTTQEEFPEIIEAAEVHEFAEAALRQDLQKKSGRLVDVREQAMIQLFGHSTLLNRDIGGLKRDVVIDSIDLDQFYTFGTRVYCNLRLHTKPLDDMITDPARQKTAQMIIDDIAAYAKDVQSFANSHPDTCNTLRYPIRDKFRDEVIARQAYPAMMANNWSLMVTIACDLPPDAMHKYTRFYSEALQSGGLCLGVWRTLAASESDHPGTTDIAADMLSRDHLPFVDLFPWPAKNDSTFEDAARFLRRYLRITKPIICLTLSQKVSACAVAKFQKRNGLSSAGWMQSTGKLFESSYGELSAEEADDDDCIVIPCIHPGYLNHRGNPIGDRIMARTFAVAWLAMHEALRLVSESPQISKRELCKKIIQSVEAQIGDDTDFGRTFNDLKRQHKDFSKTVQRKATLRRKALQATSTSTVLASIEEDDEQDLVSADTKGKGSSTSRQRHMRPLLKQKFNDAHVEIPTAQTRWDNALEELYCVLECEQAAGAPKSKLREPQIVRLRLLRDTMLGSANVELQAGQTFDSWIRNVPEGELFYFNRHINSTTPSTQIPNLLSVFLPDHIVADLEDWETDLTAVAAAFKSLRDWILSLFSRKSITFQQVVANLPLSLLQLQEKKAPNLAAKMGRVHIAADPDPPEIFKANGGQVTIKVPPAEKLGYGYSSYLVFEWEDDQGKRHRISDMVLPGGVLPLNPNHPRFMFFTPLGIDIKDESGRVLGLRTAKQKVTLSIRRIVSDMSTHALFKPFNDLWTKVVGHSLQECVFELDESSTSSTSALVIPKEFFEGRTLPIDDNTRSHNALVTKLRKDLPFGPGDAPYILNEFLLSAYPNGGTMYQCDPDEWPNEPCLWKQLKEFVMQPYWQNHPHILQIVAMCDTGMNERGIGGRARVYVMYWNALMEVLRTEAKKSARPQERKQATTRVSRSYTIINGTIPDGVIQHADPFPEAVADPDPDEEELEPVPVSWVTPGPSGRAQEEIGEASSTFDPIGSSPTAARKQQNQLRGGEEQVSALQSEASTQISSSAQVDTTSDKRVLSSSDEDVIVHGKRKLNVKSQTPQKKTKTKAGEAEDEEMRDADEGEDDATLLPKPTPGQGGAADPILIQSSQGQSQGTGGGGGQGQASEESSSEMDEL